MRLRLLPFAVALAALAACTDGAETGSADAISDDERAALPALVFESEHEGERATVRLDLATDQTTRLGDPSHEEVPLAISPDGRALVLGRIVRQPERDLEQLVLQDGLTPTGSNHQAVRTLTPPTRRARNPTWSEDSRWITFEADLASTSDLFRISRDGTEAERLTDNPEGNYEPHAAPGGAILFVSSRDMNAETYRMDADGSAQTRLPGSPRDDWAPRLSPDGARLALLTRERGRDEILLARPDGLDRQRIGDTRPDDLGEVLEAAPAWSPDSRSLAYVTLTRGGDRHVWIVDVHTREHRQVAAGWDPAWSPDGQYLALVSDREGSADLFLVRADGSGLTRLTDAPGAETRPLWIPL